uniref:dual-specificity kinase n=1 Tax=Ditylenchus dipsaci TaxID=166011 RepID=A0A915DHQ8_9BILA
MQIPEHFFMMHFYNVEDQAKTEMMVLTAVDPQRIPPAKKQLRAPCTSNAKDENQELMQFNNNNNICDSCTSTKLNVIQSQRKCQDNGDFAEPVVMKIPILHNNSCRVSAKMIVMKEDYMLRLLEHPNILKSRGICVQRSSTQWQLNLLVDFCDGGSLQQLILNTQKPFPWLQRCLIGLDVCRAMSYVHGRGFMHRDLTSMNILLQSQPGSQFPKAVVADFGLSSKIPQYPTIFQQVGTQNWMAPEMLKEEFYNEKADVFSFGVIMCQMIARIDADHDAGLYRTPCFGLDYCRFTASCPSETPLTLLKIAFMCCCVEPESRPSFDVLLEQIVDPGEIRLGRSRSDAAIRGANAATTTLSSRFTILPGTPVEEQKKRRSRLASKQYQRMESTSLAEPACMIQKACL